MQGSRVKELHHPLLQLLILVHLVGMAVEVEAKAAEKARRQQTKAMVGEEEGRRERKGTLDSLQAFSFSQKPYHRHRPVIRSCQRLNRTSSTYHVTAARSCTWAWPWRRGKGER